jgi:hypothetical protein
LTFFIGHKRVAVFAALALAALGAGAQKVRPARDIAWPGCTSSLPYYNVYLGTCVSGSAALPVSAGYTATANGNLGYDSTTANWHAWLNGADVFLATLPKIGITSGHCVQLLQVSGTWTLADAGGACTTGGGGGTVSSGTLYSPAYYTTTGAIVGGVTPFTGPACYSASAPPALCSPSSLQSAIGAGIYAAANAGVTVNGQTCTLGSTCTSGTSAHPLIVQDMSATAYTASQLIVSIPSPVAGAIPAGGTGTYNAVTCTSQFALTAATTASTTFTLKYNGTSFGTVVFGAASSSSPTITISSAVSVAAGGIISINAPASADTTAAGLNGSLCFAY